jgi:hypothetical protein
MSQLVRRLVIAAALMAAVAPAALAGGANAKVSGPAKDGRYTVQTYACSNPANLHVTAWAEGLVNGKRQTVPIKIEMTRAKGVYDFKRTWPEGGQWAIRMRLGNQGPHVPVTVTALEPNGTVRTNELIWEGDGTKECVAILSGKGC